MATQVDQVMTDELEEEEFEQDQYLVFTVRSQEFGLRALQVQEISSALDTTEVPNAPLYVAGILNLRGRLVSVINFRKKFGFEPKERDENTRIIILEHEGFPIGILVDSVEEVVKIPDEEVQRLPTSATTSTSAEEEYIAGVGVLDTRLVILLDIDKVLTRTELMEMSAIEQATADVRARENTAEGQSQQMDTVQPADTVESGGTGPDSVPSEERPEKAESQEMDAVQPADTVESGGTGPDSVPSEERPEKAESQEMEAVQPTATVDGGRKTAKTTGKKEAE